MATTLDSPISEPRPFDYAGFWLRFVAYVIDAILLSIAYWLLIAPLIAFLGFDTTSLNNTMFEDPSAGWSGAFSAAVVSAQILSFILYWIYFALMESSNKQATIGKLALGLIVTDMYGNKISFAKATGRYFGKILSGLIFLIGYIMAAFTEKKQALHDILAGTLVLKK